MIWTAWLCVALLVNGCVGGKSKSKDKYTHMEIVRVRGETESQKKQIEMMVDYGHFDLLQSHKDGSKDLMMKNYMRAHFQAYSFDTLVLVEDIDKAIEEQKARDQAPWTVGGITRNVTWTQYNTLEEINNYLSSVAETHPDVATIGDLSTSWEGRPVKMLTLTKGIDEDKPILFIDAGIHACEWIGPAVATYVIDQLLQDTTGLLESAQWVIVPSINPDGYQYSWDQDRFWRKTRSKRKDSSCYGVDGNRNFDFHWMEVGASDDSCTNTYAGPEANSEPEFKGLIDYMNTNKDRVKMYITLHSYSQMMMYSYGHTEDHASDWEELDRVAKLSVDAIASVHGTKYEHGSCASILYLDAGTSRDYVKGVTGVKYVYTIELRDQGHYGFLLPPEQILPTSEEAWAGILTIAKEAVK